MAARSTVAAGNWNSAAVWASGAIPGPGDTATISHAVTVPGNVAVGHSPGTGDAVAAIRVTSTGTLTVDSGVTLVCRGDIMLENSTMTMQSGSVLEFDATLASVPLSSTYKLQIGTAHDIPSRLNINGTQAARVIIRSKAGGANARIGGVRDQWGDGFLQSGLITGTQFQFERIGNSSYAAIEFAPTASSTFSLTKGVFDNCGRVVNHLAISSDANVTIEEVTWKNTLADQCLSLYGDAPKTSGKIRSMKFCVFDKRAELFPPKDWNIENNYFHDGYVVSDGVWASFINNFIRVQFDVNIAANAKDCFVLHDNPSEFNPHLTFAGRWGGRNYQVDGFIFETTSTVTGDGGAEGDCIQIGEPGSPVTVEVKNCIVLPSASNPRTMTGTLVSCLGNSNTTVNIHHNTCFIGNQGLLAVGENYGGHTGMIASLDHNIAWDDAVPRGYKMYDSGSNDVVNNIVSAANANYNCGHNLLGGTNLKGYNGLEFSSGSPGANDVDVDPQFVDSTRDLAKWSESIGGPGTVAHALGELRKRNDATGANASATVANLLSYIRAGFVPQNPALKNVGGSDIGAVAIASATATKRRMMMMGI